jgi:tetratricopeptide (TPR) repeat protein
MNEEIPTIQNSLEKKESFPQRTLEGSGRFSGVLGLFLVLFLTVLTYSYAMWHSDFLNWDDDIYLTENKALRGSEGFYEIWVKQSMPNPYPLTFSLLRLEYMVFGLKAVPFHFVNLFLHLVNICLFAVVLKRIGILGFPAFLALACYAWHPVQVETVMWVSEVKNLLCSVFYWLSFLAFFRYLQARGFRRVVFYLLMFACFVASLLSKSMSVTFPVSCLLWILLFRLPGLKFHLFLFLPFFFFSFYCGWLSMQNEARMIEESKEEAQMVRTLEQRLFTALNSLLFYLRQFFWPASLTCIYAPQWFLPVSFVGKSLFLLGVLLLGSWIFLLPFRFAHAVSLSLGSFALLNYGVVAGPILGFFTTSYLPHSAVADRYQYHPLPFLLIALALGLQELCPRLSKRMKEWGAFIFLILLFGCLSQTFSYAVVWIHSIPLWNHALSENETHYPIYYNLGNAYWYEGEFENAGVFYQKALELFPRHYKASNNYANVLLAQKRYEEARKYYEYSLQIKPDQGAPYANIGQIYHRQLQKEKAIEFYEKARNAPFPEKIILNRLGDLYYEQKLWEKAERCYGEALALEIQPSEALHGLALTFAQKGDPRQAEIFFRQALERDPFFVEAVLNWSRFYHQEKRYAYALSVLEKALQEFLRLPLQDPKRQECFSLYSEIILYLLRTPSLEGNPSEKALYYAQALYQETQQTPAFSTGIRMWILALSGSGRYREALEQVALGKEVAKTYKQIKFLQWFQESYYALRTGVSLYSYD